MYKIPISFGDYKSVLSQACIVPMCLLNVFEKYPHKCCLSHYRYNNSQSTISCSLIFSLAFILFIEIIS